MAKKSYLQILVFHQQYENKTGHPLLYSGYKVVVKH